MYVLLKMYVLLELLPKKNNAGTVKETKNARTAMDMASLTIHTLDATSNVLLVAEQANVALASEEDIMKSLTTNIPTVASSGQIAQGY